MNGEIACFDDFYRPQMGMHIPICGRKKEKRAFRR